MKKIVLMLAVAAFGTGAFAQTGAAKPAVVAKSQTVPIMAAQPGAVLKPTESPKTVANRTVGEKPKKAHKHAVKPSKAETK